MKQTFEIEFNDSQTTYKADIIERCLTTDKHFIGRVKVVSVDAKLTDKGRSVLLSPELP